MFQYDMLWPQYAQVENVFVSQLGFTWDDG